MPSGEGTKCPLIYVRQLKIRMFLIVVRINPVHELVTEKQPINQKTKLKTTYLQSLGETLVV